MKVFGWFFGFFLSMAVVAVNEQEPVEALTSKDVYQAISGAKLDGRSLAVSGQNLDRDVHRFSFKNGHFYFFSPVKDKTVMALFIGEGTYLLAPEDADEQRLLSMIHGEKDAKSWQGDFDSVLLMFTDETFAELTNGKTLANHSNPLAGKSLKQIRKTQDDDFKVNFRMRLTRALTNGGVDREGLFLAFPTIRKAPPVVIAVDPLGCRGVDIGGTSVGWEPSYVYASDKRKGGYWYAHALKDEPLNPSPQEYVDALHYEVNTEITGFENIKGKTIMRFKALVPDLHVLPIYLTGSLELAEVKLTDEKGSILGVGYVQDLDTEFYFEEPLKQGETYVLTMNYAGRKVLYDVGNGNYYVVQRTRWYPNVGVGDRADYKLIFRTPKGPKLIATGKLIKEYKEDGRKVTEWESDEPITVAGFNYGKFLQYDRTEPESGLALSVHHQALVNENLIHDTMADAVNSVRLFSSYFGKLPYSTLAMTQQTQSGFGQAWPSLVFLPYVSFFTSTQRQGFSREANAQIENSLAPHEVAHQWFGHQISAASYRDQWLEEGFAQFAAGLLIQHTMGWQESDQFWAYEHATIFDKISGSKMRYFEVAPLHMGFRMSTHKAPAAYNVITYSKGAFVVHMLRMMMMETGNREDPDAKFRAMMLDYFKTFKGQAIATADFQAMVEKHMLPNMNATGNGSMDWFFKQWVYGTQVPDFESNLSVKKEGDKYRVTGSISQKGVSDDFMVMMPVYVDFGKGHLARFALLPFKGEMSRPADWLLPLPKKPKRILINAHFDVLTRKPPGKKK